MAFKSFKYKFYSKGYHSVSQKSATSFFDSSYQYLKQNQGLVCLDTAIPQSFIGQVSPHPVVVANVNFKNVENVLDACSEDQDARRHGDEGEKGHVRGDITSKPARAVSLHLLKSRRNSDSFQHFVGANKTLVINETLSKSYYSTAAQQADVVKAEHAVAPGLDKDTRFELETASPWEPDNEPCLNAATFLQTTVEEIDRCMLNKEYNKINSLYQALKRNRVLPTLETFAQVLRSIELRKLDDDDLDNRMLQLLNCYQDLISNKIKPNDQIYTIVIGSLLKGSIEAYQTGNMNGLDFFKIALDLFIACNMKKDRTFNQEILDHMLLAVNFYPGHVSYSFMKSYLNSCQNYQRSEFFYIALMNYAKLSRDGDGVKALYEEFRVSDSSAQIQESHKYEVYSVALSALVETGSLKLAVKLLDKMLTEVKDNNALSMNTTLMLSKFLLSLSVTDTKKAYQLWYEFRKLKWVPEFSYEFYLNILANSFGDWDIAKKYYDYLYLMKPNFMGACKTLKEQLLYPHHMEHVISSTMNLALQKHDEKMITKLVEESIVKGRPFDIGLYNHIFAYMKSMNVMDDYLLRFIKSHGSSIAASKVSIDKFEFLNALVANFPSHVIFRQVVDMPFFRNFCESFDLADHHVINYSGFIGCFDTIWKSPQHLPSYSYILELHSILITRFYDPDVSHIQSTHTIITQFKAALTERFQRLTTAYKRLHLDPLKCPLVVSQAVKLINLPDDTKNYFSHPGYWDKSYPLDLSSLIYESPNTGIKEFRRLSKNGYSFDLETYKALLEKKCVDAEILDKCIKLCLQDKPALRLISNEIVKKTLNQYLEDIVLNHSLFQTHILPYLMDDSLLRLAKNCSNIIYFIERIGFPERFQSITMRAACQTTVSYIYDKLFISEEYDLIVKYNDLAPAISAPIVLKSCIRSGSYEKYRHLRKKYKSTIGPEITTIHAEYFMNQGKIQEALDALDNATETIPLKSNDLYTFGLFLKSFSGDVKCRESIEDTLQFANTLSTFNSFPNLLSFYTSILEKKLLNLNDNQHLSTAVKLEITEQMLNNLYDAIQFFDNTSSEIQEKFAVKLNNYFQFRQFLKLNEVSSTDLSQLVGIWRKVVPMGMDTLFNNIVELSYVNPSSRLLRLGKGLHFRFDRESLYQLVDDIKKFYDEENNEENLMKVSKFQEVMGDFYPVKTLV